MKGYREFLPTSWLPIIDQDPVLTQVFSLHEFPSDSEPVTPYLFQELRGGELVRLHPVFALYGQPGLTLFKQLLEIDNRSRNTSQVRNGDGKVAYAGYFFTHPDVSEEEIRAAVIDYIRWINRVYESVFHEPAPLDQEARIQFPGGFTYCAAEEKAGRGWISREDIPDLEIRERIGDWFRNLEYKGNCRELADLLSEPLYHISNDYFLSYYLQWPLAAGINARNPFLPHYQLWRMGYTARFLGRDQVYLLR